MHTNCSEMSEFWLELVNMRSCGLLVLSRNGREHVTNVLARGISYIHHTSEFKQNCHVGNTANQCKLGLFQDSDFAGDLEDSTSTSGGILCIFGSHTFVSTRTMCKKQTSDSHSSTESEIMFLDASLRMNDIPALALWNLVIEVFLCSPIQSNKTKDSLAQVDLLRRNTSSKRTKNQTNVPTTHDSSDVFHIDNVPSNAKFSQSNAMLYVFEANSAVIKMIIKGRSPTMRHVSRTHRLPLDWLFDRINLDSKIQIRYIDTKHQIADILIRGIFTRDEWNSLLHLFNISHFSFSLLYQNFSLISCTERMAKRMQEHKEENRMMAKSRPTVANLVISVPTSSSTVNSPIASRNPGILKASSRQVGLSEKLGASTSQNSNPDAASCSQGRKSLK